MIVLNCPLRSLQRSETIRCQRHRDEGKDGRTGGTARISRGSWMHDVSRATAADPVRILQDDVLRPALDDDQRGLFGLSGGGDSARGQNEERRRDAPHDVVNEPSRIVPQPRWRVQVVDDPVLRVSSGAGRTAGGRVHRWSYRAGPRSTRRRRDTRGRSTPHSLAASPERAPQRPVARPARPPTPVGSYPRHGCRAFNPKQEEQREDDAHLQCPAEQCERTQRARHSAPTRTAPARPVTCLARMTSATSVNMMTTSPGEKVATNPLVVSGGR